MTRRERRGFEAFADAVVAPEPPLPPVAETDAADACERGLRVAPRVNRVALRAAMMGASLLPEERAKRQRVIARVERGPGAPLVKGLRSLAHLDYYGDERVMRQLGWTPPA